MRARGADLRKMHTSWNAARAELITQLMESESGAELDRSLVDGVLARHGISAEVLDFSSTEGSGIPEFSWAMYEQQSTALGQKADEWLDGELEPLRAAHDDASREYVALREAGERTASLAAATRLEEARSNYYARKRELMGQLRENGQDLHWSTAGLETPQRVNETIQVSAHALPKDWIDTSNRHALAAEEEMANGQILHSRIRPVRVRESTARNHYSSHAMITRRETRMKQSFWDAKDTYVRDVIRKSPAYGIVPREEWTETEKKFSSPGDILVREYHVARSGLSFDDSPGAGAVDAEGNLLLKGKAAAGWRQHTYVDAEGAEQTCWRKPKVKTSQHSVAGYAELTIPKGSGRRGGPDSTATHELIHRCEDTNPSISSLELAFVRRRTTSPDGERQPLEPYYPNSKERVRPDEFIDRYIGKEYAGQTRFHEVMSVGTEATLHGKYGGFGKLRESSDRATARRDDDHHAFVLGTYMSA